MVTTENAQPLHPKRVQDSLRSVLRWHRIGLGIILLISAFLSFYRLDQAGAVNPYYEAGVKSMLMSWKNFFFVSFDPGGFVTLDKPPLGFWIQAASVKLFGFSHFSLLLPEALAGVLSVALLYHLVNRTFGHVAGLLAALALALSPVSISTSRNTTIDTLLVLTILLAAWAVSRAARTGHLNWLLLCAALVGLGFNIKMLEAYLVVPAFGLVYLLGAPRSWRIRIVHLLLATLVLLVVSFAWIVTVDLTPASQRPYVGSSETNSELNLALGYNGLQRLTGNIFGGGGPGPQGNASSGQRPTSSQQQPVSPNMNFFTQGETGAPGPLRLFNQQLGGQVGWLLPVAVFGLLFALWQQRIRLPLNRKQQSLILWGTWLLTTGIFFSVAGFFHTYYMVTLVPSICALFGIGIVALWQAYRRPGWSGWLLPVVLVGGVVVQAFLVSSHPDLSLWLTPLIMELCLLPAIGLVIVRVSNRGSNDSQQEGIMPQWRSWLSKNAFLSSVVSIGVLALLIAPMVWGGIGVLQGRGGVFAFAGATPQGNRFAGQGPQGKGFVGTFKKFESKFGFNFQQKGGTVFQGFDQGTTSNAQLEKYLQANQGGTTYLLAVSSATAAAPLILDTGKPVMALGGFSGDDRILTQQQLISLVENGTVRFFLLDGFPGQPQTPGGSTSGGIGFGNGNTDLTQWVNTHCQPVPANRWQSAPSTTSGVGNFSAQQLFDCANRH